MTHLCGYSGHGNDLDAFDEPESDGALPTYDYEAPANAPTLPQDGRPRSAQDSEGGAERGVQAGTGTPGRAQSEHCPPGYVRVPHVYDEAFYRIRALLDADGRSDEPIPGFGPGTINPPVGDAPRVQVRPAEYPVGEEEN